ncbi:serum amyloid P-component-like [Anomaloglossus baeobatrachus]|uniref:serum amyloid P-component-like n=1 Tax=Anomaloglossus baeobatrachus TaxID=238106 RepID=UPI003F4F76A5
MALRGSPPNPTWSTNGNLKDIKRESLQSMERSLIWVISCSLAVSGIIGQTDMNEDVFTFSQSSSDSYVRLYLSRSSPFFELTLCLRFRAVLKAEATIFSLATKHDSNAFRVMIFPKSTKQVTVTVTEDLRYRLKVANFDEWTGMCVGWSSKTGEAPLWVNEETYEGYLETNPILDTPYIVLGQEQDTYGGGYDESQCFLGDIADVNMWNRLLSNGEVIDFLSHDNITGEVMSWRALTFNIAGNVTINTAPCEPINSTKTPD